MVSLLVVNRGSSLLIVLNLGVVLLKSLIQFKLWQLYLRLLRFLLSSINILNQGRSSPFIYFYWLLSIMRLCGISRLHAVHATFSILTRFIAFKRHILKVNKVCKNVCTFSDSFLFKKDIFISSSHKRLKVESSKSRYFSDLRRIRL
jgi:hypothetical protein